MYSWKNRSLYVTQVKTLGEVNQAGPMIYTPESFLRFSLRKVQTRTRVASMVPHTNRAS